VLQNYFESRDWQDCFKKTREGRSKPNVCEHQIDNDRVDEGGDCLPYDCADAIRKAHLTFCLLHHVFSAPTPRRPLFQSGRLAQLVLPGDNPDVASLIFEHENGALSMLNASYASASEYYLMNIYGKEATAYNDLHHGLSL
jgi:hypothetical protein